jgi:hypothetical protein
MYTIEVAINQRLFLKLKYKTVIMVATVNDRNPALKKPTFRKSNAPIRNMRPIRVYARIE